MAYSGHDDLMPLTLLVAPDMLLDESCAVVDKFENDLLVTIISRKL
jgi:hypothetical protein